MLQKNKTLRMALNIAGIFFSCVAVVAQAWILIDGDGKWYGRGRQDIGPVSGILVQLGLVFLMWFLATDLRRLLRKEPGKGTRSTKGRKKKKKR